MDGQVEGPFFPVDKGADHVGYRGGHLGAIPAVFPRGPTSVAPRAETRVPCPGSHPPRGSERPGLNPHLQEGRPRTNVNGDMRYFQCGKYGHFFLNCPKCTGSTVTATSKALFGGACDEVAWNEDSQKHLCKGRLEGRDARMLIDTGCDMTMVSAEWVDPSKMNLDERVPVLCVHGDTMEYPTAAVKLQVGETERITKVAVAQGLPVPVLLDEMCVTCRRNQRRRKSFMVVTRAQKRNQGRQTVTPPEDEPQPEKPTEVHEDETPTDDLSQEEEVMEPRGRSCRQTNQPPPVTWNTCHQLWR